MKFLIASNKCKWKFVLLNQGIFIVYQALKTNLKLAYFVHKKMIFRMFRGWISGIKQAENRPEKNIFRALPN